MRKLHPHTTPPPAHYFLGGAGWSLPMVCRRFLTALDALTRDSPATARACYMSNTPCGPLGAPLTAAAADARKAVHAPALAQQQIGGLLRGPKDALRHCMHACMQPVHQFTTERRRPRHASNTCSARPPDAKARDAVAWKLQEAARLSACGQPRAAQRAAQCAMPMHACMAAASTNFIREGASPALDG